MSIRVLVADDQKLLRAGFVAFIQGAPDLVVVGEAIDGADAIAQARSLKPDVILMDIRMPGTDGLTATQAITSDPALIEVKVLVLTTFEDDDYVLSALQSGASGFLGKGVEPDDLVAAIRIVANGESLLSPAATGAMVRRLLAQPASAPTQDDTALAVLTEREREVVALAGHGLSNEAIAERLYLSPHTVKTHLNRSMSKLGTRDRAQLVVLTYQTGLVRPGDAPA